MVFDVVEESRLARRVRSDGLLSRVGATSRMTWERRLRSRASTWLCRSLLLAGLLSSFVVDSATAQPGDEDPEQLIAEALRLRAQNQDAAALPLLERAHAVAPSPRTSAQLGFVHQALAHYREALEHLTRAQAASDDPWVSANARYIEYALERVRRMLGQLVVESNVVGAAVVINGERYGDTPLPEPMWVPTGSAVVRLERAGHTPAWQTVTIVAGELTRARIDLQVEPAPVEDPPRTAPRPRADPASLPHVPARNGLDDDGDSTSLVAPVVTLALAAAFGIGALVAWVRASEVYSELEARCMPCTTDELEASSLDEWTTATNVLWIGAAASAAVSLVLFLIEAGSSDDAPQLRHSGLGQSPCASAIYSSGLPGMPESAWRWSR
jgi:hypothetical protein